MNKITVITIDGEAGVGKSSCAKIIAKKLKINYLDSGALYRMIAFKALQDKINYKDSDSLISIVENCTMDIKLKDDFGVVAKLQNQDISNKIRTEECSVFASKISVNQHFRKSLLDKQRSFVKQPGLITDGRDMGTIVFPNAFIKFFLIADQSAKIERRFLENKDKNISKEQLAKSLQERDNRDKTRKIAPLVPASDAVIIDNTKLNLEQTVNLLLDKIKSKLP